MSATFNEIASSLISQALSAGTLEVVRIGNTIALKAKPNGLGVRATVAEMKILRETANG